MVEVKCSVYFLQTLPRFWGVVEVEVYPINFSWRRRDRGGVEVRYGLYFLQPLPRFGGEIEVEVYPINFTWRRRGRGGGELLYKSGIVYIYCNLYYILGVW